MAFEKMQAFTVESKRLVKTDQFENTARLEVLAEKPIKKVVSVSSIAKITNKEKIGEIINFSGKTSYQVVYESEEGALCSASAVVEWQGKLENAVYDSFYLKATTVENTVGGFSANEIIVSSLVNIEEYAICADKVEGVANLSEDYVKLDKSYEYDKVVNFVSDNFAEVSEEEEVSGKIENILFANATVNTLNVIAGIDTVTVEGTACVSGAYTMDGKVYEYNKDVDFKREIAALSTLPTCLADADVNLDMVTMTASVNETDEKSNITVSVEMSANVTVYAKEMISLVQDAFSTQNEVENSYECVTANLFNGTTYHKETLNLSAPVMEDAVELVYVLKTEAEVTDKTLTENGTMLSGAVNVEYAYKTENGEINFAKTFAPMVFEAKEGKPENEYKVNVKLVSARLRGGEIELSLNLYATETEKTCEYIGYVSQIEEKEEWHKSNAGIRVYVTKDGEDLFAVSKALLTKPEEILKQNPNVEGELAGGTRLIVYTPLSINF